MQIFFAVPTYGGIKCDAMLKSLQETAALLENSGHSTSLCTIQGNCYVQIARNELVRLFMESGADTLFFLDDDVSWKAEDALKIVEMPDEIVAGVYRFKEEPESYPVRIHGDSNGRAIVRKDGCISATRVATGFLRVKRSALEKIQQAYPERAYTDYRKGVPVKLFDYFPQGVKDGIWVGEDFAFCDLWTGLGEKIWVVPELVITHHSADKSYPGNYHEFLLRQPGGSKERLSLSKAIAIDGWMTGEELEWLAVQAGKHSSIVEIGSHLGRSTRALADNTEGHVYAVDDWRGPRDIQSDPKDYYPEFQSNLGDKENVTAVIADHGEVPAINADMVFIDGNHEYESVARDIRVWKQHLVPGGLLCGHDSNWPGVAQAIKELVPNVEMVPFTSIWYQRI